MEQRKELTTLQEQAPAGSQESDRITWGSRTTAVPLSEKAGPLMYAPPVVIAFSPLMRFYCKRLCGA